MSDRNNNGNPGCLGALFALLGLRPGAHNQRTSPQTESGEAFPYRVRDDFLSPAEASFCRVLLAAVGKSALVCPKVGLSDILFVSQPQQNRAAFNRIAQKHVDFLLCDPDTLRPLVAVELDDASHGRADRQARDAFVDKAFAAAGLPLVRVPVRPGYSVLEIVRVLAPYLDGNASPTVGTASPQQQGKDDASRKEDGIETPLCANCGRPMVLRTASRGGRQGERFYGCPNYPRCRETRPVTTNSSQMREPAIQKR